MKKSILGICLLLFVAFSGGSYWHYMTAGFSLNKIQFDLPVNSKWDMPISKCKREFVKKLLSQEFTYFGKGRQSYVFQSTDGEYVIKFFRYHLVRPRFRYYLARIIPSLNEYGECHITGKKRQFETWMASYSIAFNQLKDETGLVYMHLTNTSGLFNQKIKLRDGVNRFYEIDADKTGFLIQKKVDLLFNRVVNLTKKKNAEKLARVIKAYLKTVASRYRKGIKNKDHAWTHNYGIKGYDEVYEIDAGRYAPVPIDTNPESFQNTLLRFTHPIQDYLKANFQEFMPTFNQILIEQAKKPFEKVNEAAI